jgi:hypothetical protein
METDYELHDLSALQRCMEIASQEPSRAEQLTSMLHDRPWGEVAEFAAYCVQGHSLNLKLWQDPPCCVAAEGVERDRAAQTLLRRMLRAGLSLYEPDPFAALGQAKAQK